MSVPIQYASFLIRIWQENKVDEGSPAADWHAEVEHIQSNHCWTYNTVEDLISFLKQQAENIPSVDHTREHQPTLHGTFFKT